MNERDLRAWLTDRASTAAPDELRARVAAITVAPPIAAPDAGRRSLRRRGWWRNGLVLAAALAASIGGATFLAGRAVPTPDVTTTLPPDGGLIAIASSGVALIDPATGDRILGLETPPGTWSAAWSPDGRLLAFGKRDAIWTMDLESGAERSVAAVDGCRGERWADCELAWSPDGDTIAVTMDRQLMLVDVASGAVAVRLDHLGGEIDSPAWSPDGATLAFVADSTLFTAPAASGPATVVVEKTDEVWLPRDVAWSPDGATLAWMAFPEKEAGTGRKHIVIAASNADGTDRRVLFDAGFCFCVSGNWGPPGFGWSPDGTQMAFVTQEGGQFDRPSGGLFVINADGTSRRFLAPSDGGRPLWRPLR